MILNKFGTKLKQKYFDDQFAVLRRHKAWVTVGVCALLYGFGLICCTRAGIFFFNIFDDYSASFSMMALVLGELLLIVYIYGICAF